MDNQNEYYRDNSHITGKLDLNDIPKAIREKQYGIDVREAMAQATETVAEGIQDLAKSRGDQENYFQNGGCKLIPETTFKRAYNE